jgi:hypothetical protein
MRKKRREEKLHLYRQKIQYEKEQIKIMKE